MAYHNRKIAKIEKAKQDELDQTNRHAQRVFSAEQALRRAQVNDKERQEFFEKLSRENLQKIKDSNFKSLPTSAVRSSNSAEFSGNMYSSYQNKTNTCLNSDIVSPGSLDRGGLITHRSQKQVMNNLYFDHFVRLNKIEARQREQLIK